MLNKPPITDAEFEVVSNLPADAAKEPFFAVPIPDLIVKVISGAAFVAVMLLLARVAHWLVYDVLFPH
jgi:hypothetical protein